MDLNQRLKRTVGSHQEVCRLVGLRTEILKYTFNSYLSEKLFYSITTQQLILLRGLIDKGDSSDDLTIQKALAKLYNERKFDKPTYLQAQHELKQIRQLYKLNLEKFINKGFAHHTVDGYSLPKEQKSFVDEVINMLSDLIFRYLYKFIQTPNEEFNATIATYENGWWQEEVDMLVKSGLLKPKS